MFFEQRRTVHVWPCSPSAAWLPSSMMDVALHPICLFRSKLLDFFFPCSALGVQMKILDERIIRAKSPNKTRSKYIAILWHLAYSSFPWTQMAISHYMTQHLIFIKGYYELNSIKYDAIFFLISAAYIGRRCWDKWQQTCLDSFDIFSALSKVLRQNMINQHVCFCRHGYLFGRWNTVDDQQRDKLARRGSLGHTCPGWMGLQPQNTPMSWSFNPKFNGIRQVRAGK